MVQYLDTADLEDQDAKSLPNLNEKALDIITLDKEEGAEFKEGGIRGWATVIGA